MDSKRFEIIPHTADLKIRAYGSTLQELFANALYGMFASVRPESQFIEYKQTRDQDRQAAYSKYTVERSVEVRSENQELLLIDFLSECLYLSDVHNEAYGDATFTVFEPTELEAIIFGVPITGFEVTEIKAVTYHDMDFSLIEGVWQATIVFDI